MRAPTPPDAALLAEVEALLAVTGTTRASVGALATRDDAWRAREMLRSRVVAGNGRDAARRS